MPIPVSSRRLVLALACLAPLTVPSSASATVGADIRVVTSGGKTLAEHTQYTTTTRIKTDRKADCFGEGTEGSGKRVRVPGPTALGIVDHALAFDRDLRPISVTDAFDFGLGICGFGGHEAPGSGFWYLKVNHEESVKGGDQFHLRSGDDVLWWLDPDFSDAPPEDLELKAPANARAGSPFSVRVFEWGPDGKRRPAEGAEVTGATEPTDADGRTTVALDEGGKRDLRATRAGDIPSGSETVFVAVSDEGVPPNEGASIYGSPRRDRIVGTGGPDEIDAGGGRDRVLARGGWIDVIRCGGGRDKVRADREDRVRRNCERVKRG